MGKYIQRPIPIDAIKYDGEPETYRAVLREIDRFRGRVKRHIDATVFVRGLNGSLKIAKHGRWFGGENTQEFPMYFNEVSYDIHPNLLGRTKMAEIINSALLLLK